MKLQGSIVALITPFYEDGTVNFERLGEILDWHIAQGTDGILVLGTTGESSTMSHEEDDAVCRFTIGRVAGRVPVIAGSGVKESNIREQFRIADGAIIGSSLKEGGKLENPISEELTRRLLAARG